MSYRPPEEPCYSLVSSIDGISLLRRDLPSLLAEADQARQVFGERGLRHIGGLQDLPNHGIFDRGHLIGLWEYDPTEARIAWTSFVPRTPELEQSVARTEAYVRDQLGDARSFSLDSPES